MSWSSNFGFSMVVSLLKPFISIVFLWSALLLSPIVVGFAIFFYSSCAIKGSPLSNNSFGLQIRHFDNHYAFGMNFLRPPHKSLYTEQTTSPKFQLKSQSTLVAGTVL